MGSWLLFPFQPHITFLTVKLPAFRIKIFPALAMRAFCWISQTLQNFHCLFVINFNSFSGKPVLCQKILLTVPAYGFFSYLIKSHHGYITHFTLFSHGMTSIALERQAGVRKSSFEQYAYVQDGLDTHYPQLSAQTAGYLVRTSLYYSDKCVMAVEKRGLYIKVCIPIRIF